MNKKPLKTPPHYLEATMKRQWLEEHGTPMPDQEWKETHAGLLREEEAKKAKKIVIKKTLGIDLDSAKSKDTEWIFWWGIGAEKFRDLKIGWVKQRLQKAIEENDLKFFIRFGRELERKPRDGAVDKISWLLAIGWEKFLAKNAPPFSYFTDEALVEYLKICTGNEKLTFDKVRKIRQRLGLKTKKPYISGIEYKGDSFRFIRVDK